MFERFMRGECSLRDAFWRYSVLGLIVSAFVTRLFMVLLMQQTNYGMQFLPLVLHSLSLFASNPLGLLWLCCYIASFVWLVVYSGVCVIGMGRTYQGYEKSKILALICLLVILGIIYIGIKQSLYQ